MIRKALAIWMRWLDYQLGITPTTPLPGARRQHAHIAYHQTPERRKRPAA